MKKLFLISALIFGFILSAARLVDIPQRIHILLNSPTMENVDEAYDLLDRAIQQKVEHNSESLNMKTLLQLCLLYYSQDQSDATYFFIIHLQNANRTEYARAIHQLNPQEQTRINLILVRH